MRRVRRNWTKREATFRTAYVRAKKHSEIARGDPRGHDELEQVIGDEQRGRAEHREDGELAQIRHLADERQEARYRAYRPAAWRRALGGARSLVAHRHMGEEDRRREEERGRRQEERAQMNMRDGERRAGAPKTPPRTAPLAMEAKRRLPCATVKSCAAYIQNCAVSTAPMSALHP